MGSGCPCRQSSVMLPMMTSRKCFSRTRSMISQSCCVLRASLGTSSVITLSPSTAAGPLARSCLVGTTLRGNASGQSGAPGSSRPTGRIVGPPPVPTHGGCRRRQMRGGLAENLNFSLQQVYPSSVIRLAGDGGCQLSPQGEALGRVVPPRCCHPPPARSCHPERSRGSFSRC